MKYKYIALNPEQKTLSGTIEANNEQEAHTKLNRLSLAILSLQEINPNDDNKSGYDRYEFEARDINGKKVIGTIAADTQLNALRRLVEEYELKVNLLYPISATENEKISSQNEVQKLYTQLQNLEETQVHNEEILANAEENSYRKKVQNKTTEIINQVKTFTQKFKDQLKPNEVESLNNEIIHLERIRNTENLDNLERSCEKLLKYIQEKELFIEGEQNIESETGIQLETQKLLSELKSLERTGKDILKPTHLKSKDGWWEQIKNAIFSKEIQNNKTPEISELIQKIKSTRHEIINYIKLIIFTRKKQYRTQAIKAVKPLFRQWWRLKKELDYKETIVHEQAILTQSPFERNLPFFSGWLLTFYLAIYFGLFFLSVKNFAIKWPEFFYIHHTAVLMYIIVAVFLAHITIKFHIWLEKKQVPFANLSYMLAFILFSLIWLNL